ncbi:unnamed protein product [Oppiella nova]|uniref:histone acetyltransferase n=1 Tax=Oppiella nova TaxID=334625 RepID=A0A7R9MHR5_9ACAR|nr:unnamed protein product [Oppiella nova]CAG2177621.1 unnamed protein product [Oppiella nova]
MAQTEDIDMNMETTDGPPIEGIEEHLVHDMTHLSLGSGGSSDTSRADARRLSIQRCIGNLIHSCQCRDADCRLPLCHKMKRVVRHAKSCKRRSNQSNQPNQTAAPGCPICKQLIALCCYHAKHYNGNSSSAYQHARDVYLLKRRIASMASMSQHMPCQQSSHTPSVSK